MNVKKIIAPVVFAGAIAAGTQLSAQTADEIMDRMSEKQQVETSKSEISMVVYPNRFSDTGSRTFSILTFARGEDETYMVFHTPKTIKGLAMLSKDGDQWVYFPSTGRVRKIAARSKDSSIKGVGGDFTYEDFGGGDWREKYRFAIVSETGANWVLKGEPLEDSTYSSIHIHIMKDTYMAEKIEYFKEGDAPVRELVMKDIRELGGRETATLIEMTNLEEDSRTVIITHNALYNIEIDDRYFSPTRFYR